MSPLRPVKLPFRRKVNRAAVAIIQRGEGIDDSALFLIQRARRSDDPWSGDMAFPGGRLQADDTSSVHTAMRETFEETGMDLFEHGRYQHRLTDRLTRHHSRWAPMVVTPHAFSWTGPDRFSLNHEAMAGVWVPTAYLANPEHRDTLRFRVPGGSIPLPCYRYQGYCIWGLSYSMIQDWLRQKTA